MKSVAALGWMCFTAHDVHIGSNVFVGEKADLSACEGACSGRAGCGGAVWNAGAKHCNLKMGAFTEAAFRNALVPSGKYEACLAPAAAGPCSGNASSLPHCDVSLPASVRARDLVSRMTLQEKVSQISTYSFTQNHSGYAPAVPRVGLPAYNYHTEGLHGVRDSCDSPSTLYPQVTAMAATGNLSLVREMAAVMGRQFRAAFNVERAAGQLKNKGCGLSVYGPTMNIVRDPRWGRSQESVSEDPFLNGAYAAEFVGGVQGDYRSVGYLQVAATCKHLAAYSQEDGRMGETDAVVTPQDLMETYLPAFRACATAQPQQVMCSYNKINGTGACFRGDVQNQLMRQHWGFNGSIVSDCDAIKIHTGLYPSVEAAVAAGLAGGCDQDCGEVYSAYGVQAVGKGLLPEATVDAALERIFEMRFKLGEFDPPGRNPYDSIPPGQSDDAFSKASALRAAMEAVCLLNNSAGRLPLRRDVKLAVVGALANDTAVMFGAKSDYSPSHVVSVLEGISAAAAAAPAYAAGCKDAKCASRAGFSAAVEAAAGADVTVYVCGIDFSIEKEGKDRADGGMPSGQTDLLRQIVARVGAANVVVVFVNGGPVSSDYIRTTVPSVLEAFEGGQAAGTALASVLFGDTSPSGILPYTVYPEDFVKQVSMEDYAMRPHTGSPGRTYRFYTGEPAWPFGHGLSYTSFDLSWADGGKAVTVASAAADGYKTSVRVANTGAVPSAKTLLFFAAAASSSDAPKRSLVGVKKVHVPAGGSADVEFSAAEAAALRFCVFGLVDGAGVLAVQPGEWSLIVGDGQNTVLKRTVHVTGDRIVKDTPPQWQ
eukprot:TRINITY_DN2771_c0_g1_i1.p1 TRINITY_DN2771_c0_g1~~TRINITY_DN2771_c0_g1_i1.p1  ORF type:complete len:822 (+),score=323.81 TRINITY_DN2771_c0_g1_i1:43-2508(+)